MNHKAFTRRKLLVATVGSSIATYTTRAAQAHPQAPLKPGLLQQGSDSSIDFLARLMDRNQRNFPVYIGAGVAENNFVLPARMTRPFQVDQKVADAILPPMDMNCLEVDHKGLSCIKAQFNGTQHRVPHSGGWYFMNGILPAGQKEPQQNWGAAPNAGIELKDAIRLSFRVRGSEGGERVKFFCGGIGRDQNGRPATDRNGILAQYPDSAPTLTPKDEFLTLTNGWQTVTIELNGAEMGYTLGGFGWVAKADQNPRRDITFYIDDIVYELKPAAQQERLKEPRLLVSYIVNPSQDAFDTDLRSVAFVYDNALAILAFLADGAPPNRDRARIVADALVYAQQNDRLFQGKPGGGDGRLRTAYIAGSPVPFPGWGGGARSPGWMMTLPGKDRPQWVEDNYFCGINTGNMAWACLALLAYHEMVVKTDTSPYLKAASGMARYIVNNLKNTCPMGGYFAGFETKHVKPQDPPPASEHGEKLPYCATEHALDLYAVFCRLAFLTRNQPHLPGEPDWSAEASHAKTFLGKMWDDGTPLPPPPQGAPKWAPWQLAPHKFWTGTDSTATGINRMNMPVDIQSWALLSLRGGSRPYQESLKYAESFLRVREKPYFDGYGFKQNSDGVWPEGTGQLAVGLRHIGDTRRADALVDFLQRQVIPEGEAAGGLYAALPLDPNSETIDTGFELFDKRKWLYYRRPHVGATAWFILAKHGVNPFWLGSAAPEIP